MHYLYGLAPGGRRTLVATFGSEAQCLAYVSWATLKTNPDGTAKFEQGSPLATYRNWEHSRESLTEEDPTEVAHNPTPSML